MERVGEQTEAKDYTIQSFRKAAAALEQTPLSNEATYARLPDGTNLVSMKDGSFRLALPVRLSVKGSVGAIGGVSKVSLTVDKPERQD